MKEKPVFAEIENFNEKLKELCDKKRIAFIDSSDLMSDEYYEQDGIHFKASFYPVWAEKMAKLAVVSIMVLSILPRTHTATNLAILSRLPRLTNLSVWRQ